MFGAELPNLTTQVPGPRSEELADLLARSECPALTTRRARHAEASGASHDPITWREARGANVRDVDGNVFVDLSGGFGAALFAHAHPPLVAAVREQTLELVHALGDVHPSARKVELLAELSAFAPFPARVILGLSGADAVEAALKTAALHTGRPGVVAFAGGYHGLSHGPLALCGYAEGFRAPFAQQLNPHVAFAQFPEREHEIPPALASVHSALAQLGGKAGAILVEPIQGRGGMRVAAASFLARLTQLAKDQNVLLIVDEIYTGLARCGARWAHAEAGADADLICVGKGLGGGFPISACLGRTEVMAAWGDPDGEALHTSTFLGNPPACAAALATLSELRSRDTASEFRARHAAFVQALSTIPSVRVTGRGLMMGIEVRASVPVLALVRALLECGYIVLAAGAPPRALGLTPPLCITDAQIAGFARALAACLERWP